jgi:hypothetical protein
VNFKTALAGLLANVAVGIVIALLLSCLHQLPGGHGRSP